MNEFERDTQTTTQRPGTNKVEWMAPEIENNEGLAGPIRPSSQVDRAIDEFEQEGAGSAPAEPTVIEMLMNNANILIQAKEQRLALNILRNVLMREPEHPEALRKMGNCLRKDGRLDEALKCFRALAKTEQTAEQKLEAQILIGETLYLSERDEAALASYREVLRQLVKDPAQLFEIYKNIGNIHVRAGDFESAEEFYNKAYALNPKSDVLMVNYGTLEIQRDALAEAVNRFRCAVEFNSNNDKAWVGLAIVHRQMGDLELAWANVLRALDINRKNRTAIRLVIEWSTNDCRFNLAISRLQEYLEVDGEDAEIGFTLAKIFTHVGRIDDARLELERVLALDPMIEGGERLRVLLDREISKRPLVERN